MAGCLVAGAVAGPGMLGLVSDSERVRALAEVGVVFLLFEIGLELPFDRLRRLWRRAMLAGTGQVIVTMALVAWGARAAGLPTAAAVILGGLVAMSSTALVMRQLGEQGQLDSPHGQLAISILILQDLSIVPLLLAIPLLAAGSAATPGSLALAVGRLLLAIAVVLVVVRLVVPRVLARAARAGSADLFSVLALLVVLGSAFFAGELGLTFAVGAFLAGVAASTSPYAHQLFSEVVPLRGVLLGIFFTAVGMLFDPRVLVAHPGFVATYLALAVLLKGGVVVLANGVLLRQSARIGVMAGLALAQTGEFSFVLAGAAREAGLIEAWLHQGVIAGSILSLLATPFLIRLAPWAGDWVSGGRALDDRHESALPALPVPTAGSHTAGTAPGPEEGERPSNGRVVIVGFGPGGQTLARVLRSLEVPYVVIEANALGAERAREGGEPVVYGDATRPALLQRLDVANARLVVIAISDPLATRRIVSRIRSLSRDVPLLARTRYMREVDPLEGLGATTVVAEEFEGSIELVARALRLFRIPDSSIGKFTDALREGGYGAIRGDLGLGLDPWLVELLQEAQAHWVEVPASFPGATSLAQLGIRAATGANVLAVARGDATTTNPPPSFPLQPGDRLLALGDPQELERLEGLLGGPAPQGT